MKVDHNKSPNKPRYNLQLVVLLWKWYDIGCEVSWSGPEPGFGNGSGPVFGPVYRPVSVPGPESVYRPVSHQLFL